MGEIVLENVSKIYNGKVTAVDKVNLTIEDRRFVVLVGPSGCGKSTTLRMIAGLEEISSGEVRIDGRVVNDIPPKDRDIAMVFQNYALYPHMTVYENMAFGLKMRKFKKDKIQERVMEAAEILSLENLLDRKPGALSGGQRQRVALGRAIVRDPRVFLFDEPLSNLDAKLRIQMRTEIIRLHKRLATTMVYVTHDQTEAMTMGDTIVVMKDGVVQQIGAPVEVYRRPDNVFVAGFIGTPSMNFLNGVIENKARPYFVCNGTGSLKLELPTAAGLSGNVVFGIRPEDIYSGPPPEKIKSPVKFKAVVDVLEHMGSETLVHLDMGGEKELVMRGPGDFQPRLGESLELYVDFKAIHLFDEENGKRIQ